MIDKLLLNYSLAIVRSRTLQIRLLSLVVRIWCSLPFCPTSEASCWQNGQRSE